MTKTRSLLPKILAALLASAAARVSADVLVTTDGARIVGTIATIHGGVITVETAYAGELKVKQGLVTSIVTDKPIAVRLTSGDRVIGTVSVPEPGKEKISGVHGDSYASMEQIASSWAAGDEDPDIVALRRKWNFDVGLDITGESGTRNSLGTEMDFAATLAGPADTLKFYTGYNRQVTDGQKSADMFKAGVDYEDNFSDAVSWYVRDEAGYDRIMDITFSDVAAAGLGYDFVKNPTTSFTGRVGISYRQYDYAPVADTTALNAVGADFELEYAQKFGSSQLTDKIDFVPEFQDTSNFLLTHDLKFEVPLTKSLWKLAMGMSNNYNSRPVPGVLRLETLYYTKLELTWGQK